jgi:hypothetical protein
MTPAGLPHSEILGSKLAGGSPRLIAASHVLHRLLAPRHPPFALSSLTITTWCSYRGKSFDSPRACRILSANSVPVFNCQRAGLKPRSGEVPGSKLKDLGFASPKPTALRLRAGGADRDRTDDLLVANQALSQLSYSPCFPFYGGPR